MGEGGVRTWGARGRSSPFRRSAPRLAGRPLEHLAEIRGKRERSTLDVEWVLQHQFLELHMKDAAEPPQYEALVLIGEDRADGRYVSYWCDSFGGKLSAVGHGKRSGDAIELAFEYPDGPFYNTFTRDSAKGTWTFLMEGQGKDGKRTFFARDTLSRR
jgi:hypothetical protein